MKRGIALMLCATTMVCPVGVCAAETNQTTAYVRAVDDGILIDPETETDKLEWDEFQEKFGDVPEIKEGMKIAYVTNEYDNEFWVTMAEGAKAQCEEWGIDINVQFSSDANDVAGQLASAETLFAEGYDAYIFTSLTDDCLRGISEKIREAGYPVINAQSQFIGSTTSFIGPLDSTELYSMGEKVVESYGENVKVLIVDGDPAAKVNQVRVDSFKAALPDTAEIVQTISTDWSTQTAMEKTIDFFNAGGEADVAVCISTVTAAGVIEAIRVCDKVGEISVFSYDGNESELRGICEGIGAAAWFGDAGRTGRRAVECAVRAAAGQEIPKVITYGCDIITFDNVDEYYEGAAELKKEVGLIENPFADLISKW